MYIFFKKWLPYFIILFFCIGAYFLCTSVTNGKKIAKEIIYTSNASEVYMVWGVNHLQMPPREFWPVNSYTKDKLVYTKMEKVGKNFSVKISLPYNTVLNYWMVQRKDEYGKDTDIWDSGGIDRDYFTITFKDPGLFNPGYFIFLAGFLPLLLFYFKNRATPINSTSSKTIFKTHHYIPQLDSIRAIAVLLVIIHHWFHTNKVLNFLPNGPLGVNTFFVLSGFLITAIY